MTSTTETLRRLYGPARAPFEPTYTWQLQGQLIHGLAVLPGGELFVSASEDGSLVVASLTDGQVTLALEGHDGPVNSLCLTQGGARLVTGGDDGTVRVWDVAEGQVLQVLAGHSAYVREVAAAGGVVVSGGEDDTVRFWDPSTGQALHVGAAHREHLRTVALSADGRRAASSGLDNRVVVWDVARGEVERTLYDADANVIRVPDFGNLYIASSNRSGRGHPDAPRKLLFLDGGRTLASFEKEAIFWDLETGEERLRWPRGGWGYEDVALHPDGRLLVLGGHGFIEVWDVVAGARVTTLGRGGLAITAVAFAPDGRWLLTGSDRGVVQVWDFAAALQAEDGCPHQHSICGLATRGERALTCDTGGTMVLWDLAAPGPLRTLDGAREANGQALALTADAALTGEADGFVAWDADTGARRRRVVCAAADETATPHALAGLADGRVLVGFLGEGLALAAPGAGEVRRLVGETRQISILAVAPDGRHAASSGYFERAEERARADREARGGYVYVPSVSQLQGWDLEAGALLWTVAAGGGEDYVDFVFCLFTPDGRLVTRSGEDERELAFWDPRTGAVVQTVTLPGNYPVATRLVGRELVTLVFDEAHKTDEGWPGTVVRVDLATGELTHRRPLGRLAMNAAFSPDGWRLAVGEKETLTVYDARSGERVADYACAANVRELSFTDDGRRLVIGDQAGRVHVLELAGWTPTPDEPWTPEELAALREQTAARVPVRPGPGPAKLAKTAGAKKATKASIKKAGAAKKRSAKKEGAKKTKVPAKKAGARKKASAKKATKVPVKKAGAAKKAGAKNTKASVKKVGAVTKAAKKTKKASAKKTTRRAAPKPSAGRKRAR